MSAWDFARLIAMLPQPTERFMIRKERNFTVTLQELIQQKCPTLICSQAVFPVNHSPDAGLEKALTIPAELYSLNLPESSETSDLRLFCLKTSRDFLSIIKGKPIKKSSLRFLSWGILLNGVCLTQEAWLPQERKRVYIVGHHRAARAGKIFNFEECGGADLRKIIGGTQGQRVYDSGGIACTQCAGDGGQGVHTGLYTVDMNPDPKLLDYIRCIVARYDSGITNFKGTSSGVLVEMSPRVIDLADKSEFFESERTAYAVVVVDENGKERYFRIRKLMPLESWRAQGFTTEQFNKAAALGICDSRLYKMSGNSVSVPVIKAIGERIRDIIFDGGEKIA